MTDRLGQRDASDVRLRHLVGHAVALFLFGLVTLIAHVGTSMANSSYPDNWYVQRHTFKLNDLSAEWPDERISRTVQRVARIIENANNLPKHFVEVDVTACTHPRAAISNGGWINICLPLAMSFEFEDEIAFIIAHEVSHLLAGHLSGPNKSKAPEFQVDQEIDADCMGIELAVRAGYSPDGAINFLRKVRNYEVDQGNVDHLINTKRRLSYAYRFVDERFAEASRSVSFTPLSDEYLQGIQYAEEYLNEISEIYNTLFIDLRSSLNIEPKKRDVILARSCNRGFDILLSMSRKVRFEELLVSTAAALYARCFPLTGIWEKYAALMEGYPGSRQLSPRSGAAFLMARMIMHQKSIDLQIVQDLKKKIFQYPSYFDELPEPRKSRSIRNYMHAMINFVCDVVGSYDLDKISITLKHYTDSQIRTINHHLGSAISPILSGCEESFDRSRATRRDLERRVIESRLKYAGYNREQAYWYAQHESRALLASSFVGDAQGFVLMTNSLVSRNR